MQLLREQKILNLLQMLFYTSISKIWQTCYDFYTFVPKSLGTNVYLFMSSHACSYGGNSQRDVLRI